MSMEEYAEIATRENGDHRDHDEKGRVKPAHMTDRELAVETVTRLRSLEDGLEALMTQVGPSLQAMQNGPLGRMLGAGK